MYDGLTADARTQFFNRLIGALRARGVTATVVIEDTKRSRAITGTTPEMDVVRMLLERISNQCTQSEAFIVVDRPSGGRVDEDRFLRGCLETINASAGYVQSDRIAHSVVSTPSHLSRLLQAADVVTSCTLATVAGEHRFAPPVFEAIKPLFVTGSSDQRGGFGVKLHPDFRYVNLYHWVLGDEVVAKFRNTVALPLPNRPYARDGLNP
jgi:hypothetical protein